MKAIVFLLFGAHAVIGATPRTRAQGECSHGNTVVTSCTVTVYLANTRTPAVIYAADSETPKTNPFTADAAGRWFFYGAGRFDVVLSGGGLPEQVTIRDLALQHQPSVYDYGAAGDGSHDDTPAFMAAFKANAEVLIPPGVYSLKTSVIPSGKSVRVVNGALLKVEARQTVTIDAALEAGDYQIFSGDGSVALRSGNAASPLWFGGVDILERVHKTISALGPGCGTINIPKGDFAASTSLQAAETRSCTVQGAGGMTAGATPATRITFTGVGTIFDARSTAGFTLRNIQVVATNPAFRGIAVDFSHSASGGDAALGVVEHCAFFATPFAGAGARFDVFVNLDKAIMMRVSDSVFQGGRVAIQGVGPKGGYSNSVVIVNNVFGSTIGTISGAMIANPGDGWSIIGNTAEMGTGTGVAKFVACDQNLARGVNMSGNWIGDWPSGTMGFTDIEVCGAGWNISSNLIATPGTGRGTLIKVKNNAAGILITANSMTTAESDCIGVEVGSGVKDLRVMANAWGRVSTLMSGTPESGMITGENYRTVVYGGETIRDLTVANLVTSDGHAGVTRTVNVKGRDGNTCNLVFRAGLLSETTCP